MAHGAGSLPSTGETWTVLLAQAWPAGHCGLLESHPAEPEASETSLYLSNTGRRKHLKGASVLGSEPLLPRQQSHIPGPVTRTTGPTVLARGQRLCRVFEEGYRYYSKIHNFQP